MSREDKTPTDNVTTLEMVFQKLDEVGADAKLAVTEAREAKGFAQAAAERAFQLNERFNLMDRRLTVVEASRLWLPLIAIFLATLALLRT